jgi:broad specificity phosphatase PhoE
LIETGEPRARLIRHAQASWGSADYDCLSPLGETQARHLGEWLAGDRATSHTQVIRGSMRRHAQTMAAIEAAFAAAGRPLPATRIDPDWNEFDHEPVLRAYAAANPHDPRLALARAGEVPAQRALLIAAVQAWRADALDGVEESWAAFGRRVALARTRILGAAAETVLIVTSGGAMWRCAQAALELDEDALSKTDLVIHNTGISEFGCTAEPWRMLSWNQLPHLAAPEHQAIVSHY